jgi:hypothetical protein
MARLPTRPPAGPLSVAEDRLQLRHEEAPPTGRAPAGGMRRCRSPPRDSHAQNCGRPQSSVGDRGRSGTAGSAMIRPPRRRDGGDGRTGGGVRQDMGDALLPRSGYVRWRATVTSAAARWTSSGWPRTRARKPPEGDGNGRPVAPNRRSAGCDRRVVAQSDDPISPGSYRSTVAWKAVARPVSIDRRRPERGSRDRPPSLPSTKRGQSCRRTDRLRALARETCRNPGLLARKV